MAIEVNYNGLEKEFDSIQNAEAFCKKLMKTNTGSDIWVNNELYKTYMYNPFTGEFKIS